MQRAQTHESAQCFITPEGPARLIETDYAIGQHNIQPQIGPFGLDIHNPVFVVSGLTIVAFVILTLAFQNSVGPLFTALRDWLTASFDWFFLAAANVFVLLCLVLVVSPLGRIRIGGRDATPDYSYTGWFAMLFARAAMSPDSMATGMPAAANDLIASTAPGRSVSVRSNDIAGPSAKAKTGLARPLACTLMSATQSARPSRTARPPTQPATPNPGTSVASSSWQGSSAILIAIARAAG